jgi:hypothetical protein
MWERARETEKTEACSSVVAFRLGLQTERSTWSSCGDGRRGDAEGARVA